MSMSIVARDSIPEPQRVMRAKVVSEHLFHILARQAGIPSLNVTEQAFFRCQKRAQAIDLNAAALQHHAPAFAERRPHREIKLRRPDLSYSVVELRVFIFCPAIKSPVQNSFLPRGVTNKCRTEITSPTSICRDMEELDRRHLGTTLLQKLNCR